MSRNNAKELSAEQLSAVLTAREQRKEAKRIERLTAWGRLIEAETKAKQVPGWKVGELLRAVAQRAGKSTNAICIAKSPVYYGDNSPATLNKIADKYLELAAEKQAENELRIIANSGNAISEQNA